MAATYRSTKGRLSDAEALQAVVDAFVQATLALCRQGIGKTKELQVGAQSASLALEQGNSENEESNHLHQSQHRRAG